MTSWCPADDSPSVNECFQQAIDKFLGFKCDTKPNAKKSDDQIIKTIRIKSGTIWLRLVGVFFSLAVAACSKIPEYPHRPSELGSIKPSNGPVKHAHISMSAPLEREQRQPARIRPLASLPKPLLAKVITPDQRLQCVPYARKLSNIQIRGNAWTWWDQAEGRYERKRRPMAGAVMVLKRKQQPGSLGHVAYVEDIVDDRMIIVSHANWLNEGRLHINTPVLDISEANDWSEVRFWHTPGHHFGGNIYRPYGFILSNQSVNVASRL